MLTLHFNPTADHVEERLKVAPPYELVARFILSEAQCSVHGATEYARLFREVISGARAPIECEEGNSWAIDADPEWTTLSNSYGWSPMRVRVRTAWLVDALERWRQPLIDRGCPLDE